MPRLVNTCVLAAIVVFVFVSLGAFFQTPSVPIPHSGDDSLQGAFDQIPAKHEPPPSVVYDAPVDGEKPEKEEQKEAPKHEEPKVETPKKEEEKPKKQEEEPIRKLKFPEEAKTFNVPKNIVYSKDGPKPSEVVLLAASDGKGHNGGIPNLMERTLQNRKEYAEFHGYNFHFINITRYDLHGAKPVWAKLPAIVDTFNEFPDAQWVWWLDLDAILMSPQLDLNSHLLSYSAMESRIEKNSRLNSGGNTKTDIFTSKEPNFSEIDVIVGQDHNGLNAGSFFIRRSEFSRWLLDIWADPKFISAGWPGEEQDALLKMVLNHKSVRDHVGYVNQRVLNAYPVGGHKMGWFTGDLVVHLAGCWVDHKCAQQFEDFWGRRKTVEQVKLERQGGLVKE